MFALLYVIIIVVAGLPLAVPLLRARGGEAVSIHQVYRDLLRVVGVILGIIILEVILRVSFRITGSVNSDSNTDIG